MTEPTAFPREVEKKLGWYVYQLIDPRDGTTFYIGKGQGNRVFDHVHEANKLKGNKQDNKVLQIGNIIGAGLEVGHVIHRHGWKTRKQHMKLRLHLWMRIRA